MIKKYTAVEETKQITIEELIGSEGRYVGPTVGVSMLPMLKTGRDSVVKRGTASPAGRGAL